MHCQENAGVLCADTDCQGIQLTLEKWNTGRPFYTDVHHWLRFLWDNLAIPCALWASHENQARPSLNFCDYVFIPLHNLFNFMTVFSLQILLLILSARATSYQNVHFHEMWEESVLERSVCFEGGGRGLEKSKCQLCVRSAGPSKAIQKREFTATGCPLLGTHWTALPTLSSAHPGNLMQLPERGLLPPTHYSDLLQMFLYDPSECLLNIIC